MVNTYQLLAYLTPNTKMVKLKRLNLPLNTTVLVPSSIIRVWKNISKHEYAHLRPPWPRVRTEDYRVPNLRP
jgi:hypothetical protein